MSNKPLLSIIVPVYNVEQYLPRCLDSILAQTFTDFEVIAVDDGSPDNCGQILDEYAQKDKRIKVIHKENGGVSSARNAGLDVAVGEYIGFVDPDDTIFPDMYEHLYSEAVAGNYDIVQCGCIQVNEAGDVIQNLACNEEKEYTNTDDMLCDFFECVIINSVWNKIYRFDIVKNVRFMTELRVAEDGLFVHGCLLKAQKVKIISRCSYCYFISNSSVIHSKPDEKIFDNLVVLDMLYGLHKDNGNVLSSFKKYDAWLTLIIVFKVLNSKLLEYRDSELIQRVVGLKDVILKGKFSKKEKIFTLMLCVAPKITYKLTSLYLKW